MTASFSSLSLPYASFVILSGRWATIHTSIWYAASTLRCTCSDHVVAEHYLSLGHVFPSMLRYLLLLSTPIGDMAYLQELSWPLVIMGITVSTTALIVQVGPCVADCSYVLMTLVLLGVSVSSPVRTVFKPFRIHANCHPGRTTISSPAPS